MHPMMASVFEELQSGGLFGQHVQWIAGPLTKRAASIQNALDDFSQVQAILETSANKKPRGSRKRTLTPGEDEDQPAAKFQRSSSSSVGNSGRIASGVVSLPLPDGLFSLHPRRSQPEAQIKSCEQRSSRMAVEWKSDIHSSSLFEAVRQGHRDRVER